MTVHENQQFHEAPIGHAEEDSATADSRPTVRIRNIPDLLAWVPYWLGFHPSNSLCVLGLDHFGSGGAPMLVRLDLPHGGEEAQSLAEYVTGLLTSSDVRMVVAVGYGSGEQVTPMIEAIRTAIHDAGLIMHEALLVEDGRYWSYLCSNPACCPPEGTPYQVSASPIAATASAAGLVALNSREDVARSVAPVDGAARTSMRQATDRAEQYVRSWLRDHGPAGIRQRMVDEGVPYVRDVITCGRSLDDDEVAWLGLLLSHLRVRDEAWVRTDIGQLELWRDVLRRVEEPYAPAPACLTAYAAYLSGNGALANVALDRAFAADPGYTMAGLLRDMMQVGVPPWKARVKMTPEDLAAHDHDTDQADESDLKISGDSTARDRA